MAEAKELFGRGSRNYCMKQYSDAADDLSACCTIYSELYGPTADECGSAYLLYAKSLIALGKDENNLIVPGEGEEEEDDGDEDGEEGDEEEDGEDDGEEKTPEGEKEDKSDNNSKETSEAEKVETKESKTDDTAAAAGSSSKMEDEPQPGPSTSNGEKPQNEETEEDEEEKCEGNLEVAWEILELAVKIFERQGEPSLDNLSECYAELAMISLENGNFGLAINDYNKALAVYDKTGKSDRRVIAEIHYKIGLCHLMQNEYDESIKAFREACSEMDTVIQQEKAKEQDEKTKAAIKNLEETKQEVMEKIAEVEDSKKTSIEVVKRELSKIIVKCDSSSTNGFDGAGPSSSSSTTNGTSSSAKSTEKPTDITHLIKRKKPDSATTEVEGSPAKKTAVEADKSSD